MRQLLGSALRPLSDMRQRRRRDRKLLVRLHQAEFVVVSLGKSGRTWLRAMISHLYHQRYGVPENELIDTDNFHRINPAAPKFLFTHDLPSSPWNRRWRPQGDEPFRDKRVLLLVRDPRDVIASLYFHLKTRSFKNHLHQGITIADLFLDKEHGRLPQHVRFLNAWLTRQRALPNSLLVRYEDMRSDAISELRRVADFLNGGFSEDEIARAVAFASLENLREKEATGFFNSWRLRPTNPDDPNSYKVRRGKVGGWRDYLSAEDVERIDAYVEANLDASYRYTGTVATPDALEEPLF